jgi:hypothetical protein
MTKNLPELNVNEVVSGDDLPESDVDPGTYGRIDAQFQKARQTERVAR